MEKTNRSSRRTPVHPTIAHRPADTRFPRAVIGEEYERFARAMWRQGERWFRRHSAEIAAPDLATDDARTVLASIAANDLGRLLYPQEENLLSELLQRLTDDPARHNDRTTPEIPAFLLDP